MISTTGNQTQVLDHFDAVPRKIKENVASEEWSQECDVLDSFPGF